jgi:putative hydrolase of the HAD superfamily
MPITAVTFDCWGTLIADRDMSAAVRARAEAIVEASAGRLSLEQAQELGERAWRAHHAAWVSGEHFGSPGIARFVCAELGLDDGWSERLCLSFEDASLSGVVEPLPGAADSLRTLRSAGITTALVCDTGYTPGRIVRRFLDGFGIELEALAFSNEVGVPKPDVRMFRHALDLIGAEPAQAVHVGDLLRTDVAGARAAGMGTVRITAVNPAGDTASFPWLAGREELAAPELPEADEVIASHEELLPALRRLGAAV